MRLHVEDVRMRFGGFTVLHGVSFEVAEPQVIGLIGPNGAGKTTLTNIIGGYHHATGGAVTWNGERIDALPPYQVVRRGLGRTFQVPRPFARLSVLDNLRVPAFATRRHLTENEFQERADDVLQLVTMTHLAHEQARALSGGQRKLLELARLAMVDPDLLILDEPFAGVHPNLRVTIYGFIEELHRRGKAVLLISHEMPTIFALSERLLVLAMGRLIADGDPAVVRKDAAVIEAYLGTDEEEHDA